MPSPSDSSHPAPSVFLSYASEDRPAAQTLRDALTAFGLEVWYDESGLDGGDAWDQKIRRLIRECDFFMPLISAHTEARAEGYFRREWRLAVERTLDMADDHTFLLPVVIDDTNQGGARVPEKFLSVQWLRVPGGRTTPALEARCRRLVAGQTVVQPPKTRPAQAAATRLQARTREYPPFPRQEPGQTLRFWLQAVGWGFQSAWVFFQGLPRWVRAGVYIWLAIVALEATPDKDDRTPHNTNVTNVGSQIARQITAQVGQQLGVGRPLLAIPFSVLADDPASQQLADSTFAQVYGRLGLSHSGYVSLTKERLPAPDLSAAVERGRAHHAKYVLFGAVDNHAQSLSVRIVAVADGSLLWSQSYSMADADPAKIAADVASKVPALGD